MPKVKEKIFRVKGYDYQEKEAVTMGNVSQIYLPPEWAGKEVTCVRLKEPEKIFVVKGFDVLEKEAASRGTGKPSRIYLPASWAGEKVACILVEKPTPPKTKAKQTAEEESEEIR